MASGGAVKKRQLGGLAPVVGLRRPVVRPAAVPAMAPLARAAGARAARRVATGYDRGGKADNEEKEKTPAKRQLGGLNPVTGARPIVAPPRRPPIPTMVPPGGTALTQRRLRPAPGIGLGFKKGGKTKHADVAEDKKLIKSEFKKLEAKEDKGKRAAGGFVPTNATSKDPGLIASKYRQQGAGYRATGGGIGPQRGTGPHMTGGAAGGKGRLEKARMAAKVPADTEV